MPVFSAQAGFFSIFSDVFSKLSLEKLGEKPLNSQTLPLLQAAVNPDPNPGKGGGDITIIGGTALFSENGPSGTIADVEDNNDAGHISIYVVREGDSLSDIAKIFGVSVNTIVWANDIKGGIIKPGQTLVILPISGIKYTVKKGDTLQSIAKLYKADLDEILQYNNLNTTSKLAIGDEIVIPDGEISL